MYDNLDRDSRREIDDAVSVISRFAVAETRSRTLAAMYLAYSSLLGDLGETAQRPYHECSLKELRKVLSLFMRLVRMTDGLNPCQAHGLIEYAEAIGSNPVDLDVLSLMNDHDLFKTAEELATFMDNWNDPDSNICEDITSHPEYLSRKDVIRTRPGTD